MGVLLGRAREIRRLDPLAELQVRVAEVVRRLVHDVDVEVFVAEVGDLPLRGRERLREVVDVGARERHPEHRLHPADLAQPAEGLDLPPPAALDAADLVVHRLVAVGADRDDELLGAHAHDLARGADDLVGQVAVGREVEEDEVLAVGDDRLADLDEVLAE